MIRIAIVDDHALMRAGVKQIIASTDEMIVVAEATQGAEAMELVRNTPCDVLVLDMFVPGSGGAELIGRIHAERPSLPILVLSMNNESEFVSRALKAGAAGYVTKYSEPEVLLAALRKLAAGENFIDPAMVNQLVFEPLRAQDQPHQSLSNREYHVLQMFAQGKNATQMAKALQLSTKTISTHKTNIKDKLGLRTDVDLLRYAIEHRVVAL